MKPSAAGSEPVNILLVADRPNNLIVLKGLLERPRFNLVLAHAGEEAQALVLREEFAVVLMDVGMPGMDGLETAAIMKQREKSRHIPIIFVTASVFESDQTFRGYSVGAVDYLSRPIDPMLVSSKVAVFVELYRQRKQIGDQARRLAEAEARAQRLLREKVEAALLESEALYKLTFDEAPVGIGHAEPEGIWIDANRRLLEILGSDSQSIAGHRIEELVVPGEQPAPAEKLRQLHQRVGAGYKGEHRLQTARRAPVWAEVTLCALRDPAGGPMRRIIVVVEDISDHPERARVSVRDHGPGIPLAAQERIFERFGRSGALHHFGGFGLGLWTARQLAHAHGGTLTVVSVPAEGSRFTLELPAHAPSGLASEVVQ